MQQRQACPFSQTHLAGGQGHDLVSFSRNPSSFDIERDA
jgi:hypothetical protein